MESANRATDRLQDRLKQTEKETCLTAYCQAIANLEGAGLLRLSQNDLLIAVDCIYCTTAH